MRKIVSNLAKLRRQPGGTGSERGSVAIIMALCFTAFLGFAATVTDIGILYAEKARLQNAADSAALAGVQELPSNPDLARQIAEDYAAKNGVSDFNVTVENQNMKISVDVNKEVPTYFARIWGIYQKEVSATGKAIMLAPTAVIGAVPLSILEQEFVFGERYTLKAGAGDLATSDRYTGWFGALALSGSGARDYATDLEQGYNGTLRVGQVLELSTGNISGPTQQGVNARLDSDSRVPLNTFDDYDRDAPEIAYVPIVRIISDAGNSLHNVEIVGFAAFFLEGVTGSGTNSVVTGRFIKSFVPGSKTNETLAQILQAEQEAEDGTNQIQYGLFTPKLINN